MLVEYNFLFLLTIIIIVHPINNFVAHVICYIVSFFIFKKSIQMIFGTNFSLKTYFIFYCGIFHYWRVCSELLYYFWFTDKRGEMSQWVPYTLHVRSVFIHHHTLHGPRRPERSKDRMMSEKMKVVDAVECRIKSLNFG